MNGRRALCVRLATLAVLVAGCATPLPREETVADQLARAEAGDAKMQIKLGERYLSGNGVERNDRIAAGWYRRAAEQGDAAGEYTLGLLYHLGCGVNRDDAAAFEWMRKSANHGYPAAWFALGQYYEEGTGVKRDATAAFRCYRKAAESDHLWARTFAENSIGRCYAFGIGVERNASEAASWYLKSAEAGNPAAMNNLAAHYTVGYDDEANLDMARSWRKKARAVSPSDPVFGEAVRKILGSDRMVRMQLARGPITPEEQFDLGFHLVDGSCDVFDPEQGVSWLRRSAEGGHAEARRLLAQIYAFGLYGIDKNPEEAARFARMSSGAKSE